MQPSEASTLLTVDFALKNPLFVAVVLVQSFISFSPLLGFKRSKPASVWPETPLNPILIVVFALAPIVSSLLPVFGALTGTIYFEF